MIDRAALVPGANPGSGAIDPADFEPPRARGWIMELPTRRSQLSKRRADHGSRLNPRVASAPR